MSHLYARVVGGKFTPIRYTASDLRYNQTLNNIISRGDSVYPIIGELLNTGTAQSPIYRDPLTEEIDNQIHTLADISEVITITPPGGGGDVNTIDKLIGLLGSPTLTSALLDAHVSTDIGRSDIAIMNSIPDSIASKPNVIDAIVGSSSFLSNVTSNIVLASSVLLSNGYISKIMASEIATGIIVESSFHIPLMDSYTWSSFLTSPIYASSISKSLKGITDIMSSSTRRRVAYTHGGQEFFRLAIPKDSVAYNYLLHNLSETKSTYEANITTLHNAPVFILYTWAEKSTSSYVRFFNVYPRTGNEYLNVIYSTTPTTILTIASQLRISATKNSTIYPVLVKYVTL